MNQIQNYQQKNSFPLWLRQKKERKKIGIILAAVSLQSRSKTPWWFIHIAAKISNLQLSCCCWLLWPTKLLIFFFFSHCSGKCDPRCYCKAPKCKGRDICGPLIISQSGEVVYSSQDYGADGMKEFTSTALPERFDRDGLSLQSVKLSGITGMLNTGSPFHQNWMY